MIKTHKVNPTVGVVTTEVDQYEAEYQLIREIGDRCNWRTNMLVVKLMGYAPKSTNPKFTAKSRCMQGDVFDEKRGIDIAESKTDMKFHHYMSRKYHYFVGVLQRAINELTALEEYHSKKENNIKTDLERYYNQ